MIYLLTVCFYHAIYAFLYTLQLPEYQGTSTRYLKFKWLQEVQTQNHVANWLSVRLGTKCVRIPLKSRSLIFLLKIYLKKNDLTYTQYINFVEAIIKQ